MCGRRWSYTAIKCYMIGCNCSVCSSVPKWFKSQCQMKRSVKGLVKKIGVPTDEDCKEFKIREKEKNN